MPVRKFFHKLNRSASCRFKRLFRYASTHHKPSRNKTPSVDSDEWVQTTSSQTSSCQTSSGQPPSEGPQLEGGLSQRSQVGSAFSYQWIPNIATINDPESPILSIRNPDFNSITSSSEEAVTKPDFFDIFEDSENFDEESINIGRPDRLVERPEFLLAVRNPDLDSTTSLLGEEVAEADDSDDSDEEIIEINRPNLFRGGGPTLFLREEVAKANFSNNFDEYNDSDEENIEIDWPNPFRVERSSSRLAKAIEQEQLKKFRDGVTTNFRPILPRITEESYPIIDETFTTSPPVTPPAIPLGQDSTEHVEKIPGRHVRWNIPKPSRHTFLQRMTDKLQARVSRESSSPVSSSNDTRRSPPSLYPNSSQERASYRHCEPLYKSSREAHKPRPILKISVPSQPQTLVHELESSPPKTLVRKKACHNLAMSGRPATIITRITDSRTVVERSELLTSEPDIIDFATPPSTSIVGLSTAALISSSQSPVFMTAPSSPVTLNRSPVFITAPSSSITLNHANSPPSSLELAVQVKHRDHEVEARLRTKRAEVRFLTRKLRHAKREYSEVEAILWEALLGIKRAEARSLTKELRHVKWECSEVEAVLLSGIAARSRRFHGRNH